MTLVTRSSFAGPDTSAISVAPQIPDLYAGEDLDAVAPVYIKSSDGRLYMSIAAAANEAAEIVGFTAGAAKAGQPATVFGIGSQFYYGGGLTPGNKLYISDTDAGRLDTAATTGDTVGVAQVINSDTIRVIRDSH